jgi:peptidoglycan/xylan/chitin deacetylase (PgdA/CDA1 family)
MIKYKKKLFYICFALLILSGCQYQALDRPKAPISRAPTIEDKNTNNITDIQVQEPPIDLDEKTQLSLKSFREKAKELSDKFKDAFYICTPATQKVISLTFDDGPDAKTTPKILDILDNFDVKATFFAVGQNLDRYPEIGERIIQEGHQLSNHTYSHPRPLSIDAKELFKEIEKTQKLIDGIDGRPKPKYFRPPYGLVSDEQMELLKKEDYKVIAWSIDSLDWYTEDKEDIENCVVNTIHPGAVILMHSAGGQDNRKATVDILPSIITRLKNLGYEFVTVDKLINQTK